MTANLSINQQLASIDSLDLEPIAFKLVHPDFDVIGMSIEKADELVAKYRNFLKLCAMYPNDSIVPSKEIDPVWHAHILDTAKYQQDCERVFGYMLHHFPYLGLRGPEDRVVLDEKWETTQRLYREAFGFEFVTAELGDLAAMCNGGCSGDGCNSGCAVDIAKAERPRLVRA